MSSSTSPVGPGGHEQELASTNAAHGTAANGLYITYVPKPQGQPEQPATGSHSQAPAYSEVDSNPLPQLIFGDAIPEVVKPAPAISPDAVREDFVNNPIPANQHDQEPQQESTKKAPWYRRKSVAVLITVVAIVGILAVVFGTLGGVGVLSNNNRSTYSSPPPVTTSGQNTTSSLATQTSTAGPPLSASSTTSSTTSSGSSTPTSTSTGYLPQCTQYSEYYHNASFVTGNVDMHGVGYSLPQAYSQEQCCGFCYNNTPLGCNLWVWDPTDHATVPCTLVMGYDGVDPDSQCPYGHTNSSAFTVQDNGAGIWYSGPCGDGGTVVSPGKKP